MKKIHSEEHKLLFWNYTRQKRKTKITHLLSLNLRMMCRPV